MSLTTTISVQDGAAAASNLTAGQAANVTPGNLLTIALQTSTGVLSWTVVLKSDYGPLNGTSQTFTGPTFSYSLPLPLQPCTITVFSEATDGNNFYQTTNTLYNFARAGVTTNPVRFVQELSTPIANANCNCDGVQPVQGDRILLVNQANGVQNGPYLVGVVTSNVAALTRPPEFFTGQVLLAPVVFEASEGTKWSNSTWKITKAGAVTVDTTNVGPLYPRTQRVASANLSAAQTGLWIMSNTSQVLGHCSNANSWVFVSSNIGNLSNAGNVTLVPAIANAGGWYQVFNW
jgi:hypothetical protein